MLDLECDGMDGDGLVGDGTASKGLVLFRGLEGMELWICVGMKDHGYI